MVCPASLRPNSMVGREPPDIPQRIRRVHRRFARWRSAHLEFACRFRDHCGLQRRKWRGNTAWSKVASAFFMSRIEKRPLGDYGLPARAAFGKNFWAGAVWGIVWLTILMLTLRLSGVFYFGGLAIHGGRILKFAAFYALLFLTVALFEEFSLRGYVQFTLTQGMGFWPAAILLSICFWRASPQQSGGGMDWPSGRVDWLVFLPHPAPHGKSVVRGRLSRRLGLGRKLLLFRPG